MGDEPQHECGFAMLRLLKPLEYYEEKYGTSFFGINRMHLIMEKQRNRGQDGCGVANVKLDVSPGTKYLVCEKSVDKDPIKDVFDRAQRMAHEKLRNAPRERSSQKDTLEDGASSEGSPRHSSKKAARADSVWVKENVPFAGELFLAHVRYGTDSDNSIERCHPMIRESNWMTRTLALAGNFNITNNEDLFASLVQIGQHPRELSDTCTLLEKIGHFVDKENNDLYVKYSAVGHDPRTCFSLIAENINIARILRRASTDWDGGYAIAGLLGHGDAFCLRDPCGIRPAFYLANDEVVVVASEAPLIQTVFACPADEVKPLPPGNALIIKRSGSWKIENILPPGPFLQCSFERIYFSRGNDAGVYREREMLGRLLLKPLLQKLEAKGDSLANTVLSFIPNTAELAYNGLVKEAQVEMARRRESIIKQLLQQQGSPKACGADLEESLRRVSVMAVRTEKVVHKDAKIRTFIQEDSSRESLTMHAYDIHYGTVRPKEDVLVVLDDSIVRGNTLKNAIIRTLNRLEPKRIVVLSSCPQIRYPDVYGIDMAKMGDLAAFRAAVALLRERGMENIITEVYHACRAELSRPLTSGTFTNHVQRIYAPFSNEEITAKMVAQLNPPDIEAKVDFLFNTVDALHEAMPEHKGDWYFTGDYPTAGGTKVACRAYVLWMEGSSSRCYGVSSASACLRSPPVLVLGCGGGEHALAWKLSQSPEVGCVYMAPGNSVEGRQQVHHQSHIRHTYHAPIHPVDIPLTPPLFKEVKEFCREHGVAVAIVGSRELLQGGLSDALRATEVSVFGPSKAAAEVESQGFAGSFAQRHHIPAATAPNSMGLPEVSILAFSDGVAFTVFPVAVQIQKQCVDNELRTLTDSMGAFAPSPLVDSLLLQRIEKEVLAPVFKGLREEGRPFVGCLNAEVVLTPDGPKLFALRCCLGDPVAQTALPLLDGDLFDVVAACAGNRLQNKQMKARAHTSVVAVVMASGGYPGQFKSGYTVSGLERALCVPGAHIFHTGTTMLEDAERRSKRPRAASSRSGAVLSAPVQRVVTRGGRVLTVAGRGQSLQEARERAYVSVRAIAFDNAWYHEDIGCPQMCQAPAGIGIELSGGNAEEKMSVRRSDSGLRELTYRSAGVDADACEAAMKSFEPLMQRTWQREGGSTGDELGCPQLHAANARMVSLHGQSGGDQDILVSSTNALGTKLRVACSASKFDTLGIDLVALCVNDLAARGAEPKFFNNHFSTEKLDGHQAMQLVSGVSSGCMDAGCKLLESGVAELPGVFVSGGFDLVGFAVGAAAGSALFPQKKAMSPGDVLIALPATGLHSNGFSLARAIVHAAGLEYSQAAPFDPTVSLGQALLEPTRIYSKAVLALARAGLMHGATQVTRGGLQHCLDETVPTHLAAHLRADAWELPAVFRWLATIGKLPCTELMSTFNCGIGMLLIVPPSKQQQALQLLGDMHEEPVVVGKLIVRSPEASRIEIEGAAGSWLMLPELGVSLPFPQILSSLQDQCTMTKKRVMVLAGSAEETPVAAVLAASMQVCSSVAIVAIASCHPQSAALTAARGAGVHAIVLGDGRFVSTAASCDSDEGSERSSEGYGVVNYARGTEGADSRAHPAAADLCSVVDQEMEAQRIEFLVVLGDVDAKLFTPVFLQRHVGKVLRVHASLLPAFPGNAPIEAAIRSGACVTGCSVCFAVPPSSYGPLIEQEPIRIQPSDTTASLRSRVAVECESVIVPRALQLVGSGSVKLQAEEGTYRVIRSSSCNQDFDKTWEVAS